MKKTNKTIGSTTATNDEAPKGYVFCFQDKCPAADNCVHYFARQHTGERLSAITIMEKAINGGKCQWFKPVRTIHGAYGFNSLFNEAKANDAPALRRTIKRYLGGNGTYYQYHHGERLLTPEQQEWILSLFRDYGYSGELHFDGFKDTIDW